MAELSSNTKEFLPWSHPLGMAEAVSSVRRKLSSPRVDLDQPLLQQGHPVTDSGDQRQPTASIQVRSPDTFDSFEISVGPQRINPMTVYLVAPSSDPTVATPRQWT